MKTFFLVFMLFSQGVPIQVTTLEVQGEKACNHLAGKMYLMANKGSLEPNPDIDVRCFPYIDLL